MILTPSAHMKIEGSILDLNHDTHSESRGEGSILCWAEVRSAHALKSTLVSGSLWCSKQAGAARAQRRC